MAITLRLSDNTPAGKSSELTYDEMNDNLRSFYHSSSFAGTTLTLFTTGSVSHSISLASLQDDTNTNIYNTDGTLEGPRTVTLDTHDLTFDLSGGGNLVLSTLSAGDQASVLAYDSATGTVTRMSTSSLASADTNIYNTNGTLTSARTVTANTNNLTFSFADANFQVSSGGGTGGDVIIADLRQASTDSMMMINAGTGVVSWMSTSSLNVGGGGTPGGSDTQVQFNDGGSTFGGDSGFTYNKTANRVTITAPSSPTRTAPNLLLNSEIANVALDEVFGVIAANNTTDQYNPASYPASIQFTADTTFGPGNYDARIGLFVNNNATETEALRLRSSGQNKLPQYGSGTFTGTAVYYLAVSASGDVIEAAPPGGFTRPGSATSVTYDTYFSGVSWSINSTTSGTPTANGNLSVNSTTPASVDTIKIYKNSTTGTNYSTVLENIAVSGSITLSRVSGGLGTATYKVISVTDNSTYVTLAVQDATGASGTYDNGTTTVDVDSDYEYELSTGYNRLDITNSSGQSQGFRLAAPAAASAGDKVIVEFGANASSANNIIVKYVLRSGTPSFIKVSNLYSIGDGTAYAISLDNNDVAYLEFTVFDNGSITGLLPTGAQQVIYA